MEREARSADRVRAMFADDPHVIVPQIHHALSTRRVLVMERVRGIKITEKAQLEAAGIDPADVVLELGLYGMYHLDELIERHFLDLAELVSPGQIVFNVQTANPDIEHIARVWTNRRGERCVWRLRPLEQILGYARAAGYEPASVTSDRHGIYRVVRLARAAKA